MIRYEKYDTRHEKYDDINLVLLNIVLPYVLSCILGTQNQKLGKRQLWRYLQLGYLVVAPGAGLWSVSNIIFVVEISNSLILPFSTFGMPSSWSANYHDDVTSWKRFPRYWPFVRELWCFFDISPNKLLCKHSNGRWFGTPWRSCDISVMELLASDPVQMTFSRTI